MPSEPPPSRYRVIERGGRLQVIDTWAATRPPPRMADYTDPATVDAVDLPDQSVADTIADRWPDFARALSDSAEAPSAPPTAQDQPAFSAPPPPRAAQIMTGPPELLRNVAATICGDKRDGDRRLVLRTARFYDSRAPRAIALDLEGERQLGLVVLVALAVAVGVVLSIAALGVPGIVIGGIAVLLLQRANLLATPWLDRLAARTR